MSSTRYLEFDSTYRDRTQYPNPSNFVVEISQTGQTNRDNPRDPISNASPLLFWNSSFDESKGSDTVSITDIELNNSLTDPTKVIITASSNTLRNVVNYYVGAVLKIVTTDPQQYRCRILEYQRITDTSAEVLLSSPLPQNINYSTCIITIQNPTFDTSSATVPKVFIPSSVGIDNFYKGYYIQLLDSTSVISETKKIFAYDGTTHLATLDSNTTNSWSNGNYNFVLRKELPCNYGKILQINTSGNVIQLSSDASSTYNMYKNGYMRMLQALPTGGNFSNPSAPYGEERKIIKYITGDGTFSSITAGGVSFTLNTNDNTDYKGCFITDSTTIPSETRQILTYNTTTKVGTVDSNWGGGVLAGDTYFIRTVFLLSSFSSNPTIPDSENYEIECFSNDNWNPFTYSGSLVSSQEMVCYEVELVNLILPNSLLSSGRGGRPIFYPYFYVELHQISAPTGGLKGIIYSNNPNSYKMLFRAVVDDTSQPSSSPFIKIDSDSMTHTIKFKPNDSFKFAVYHQNGELLQTVAEDYYSPKAPNPLVQVSATFSFKRV
jgi:hypothetical protein